MKTMKKLTALVVAVVMVLAMAVTTFAADTTITAPADGHTYKAYQIFTGDLADGKLSNLAWGTAAKDATADIDAAVKAMTAVNGGTNTEKLAVVEKYVDFTKTATTIASGATVTVPTGYYIIVDSEVEDTDAAESYSLNLVQIVGPTTIAPKRDVPEFEKKVKDTNDTTGVTSDFQDSADYDIGDVIPFQLKGTVADDYANYETYYFAFHDVEEKGLTFNANSVVVKIDGAPATGYTVNTAPTDGCTFEVVFAELKNTAAHAGSVITVDYTSTLNSEAVLGDQGNVNKAKLEFSNNPNDKQGGEPSHDETPWDNVIVFTYKVVVNKVDEKGDALPGAEFTLTKSVKDGDDVVVAVVKNDAGTQFSFKGLDDGNYTLTETVTPPGYNTISPITFTVNADHSITWDGTNRTDVLATLSGTKVTGEITFTADKTSPEGSLTADVENKSGATLPTTGGMGTTVIYVIGAMLVLGAGVLLITRRRVAR